MARLAAADVHEAREADALDRDSQFLGGVGLDLAVVGHPNHDLGALVLVLIGDEEDVFDGCRHCAAEVEGEAAEERRIIDVGVQFEGDFLELGLDELVDRDHGGFDGLGGGGLVARRGLIARRERVGGHQAEAQAAGEGQEGYGSHGDRLQFGKKHHPHHPFGKLDGVCGHESRNHSTPGDGLRGAHDALAQRVGHGRGRAVGAEQAGERAARERDAALGQACRQRSARAGDPGGEGRGGNAKVFRHVALGPALEIAEDDRHAQLVGQAREFLVDQRLEIGPVGAGPMGNGRLGHDVHLFLAGTAAGQDRPGLERRPVRDTVEPVADLLARFHRAGAARQHDEDGLEGVVRGGGVAGHAPTDAEDHRPVPTDEPGEGIGVAVDNECAEELPVRAVGSGPGENDSPEVGHQAAGGGRHCE